MAIYWISTEKKKIPTQTAHGRKKNVLKIFYHGYIFCTE